MDDDGALFTIGQLSQRSGLPVRTIRYWSDIGVLPPASRTGTGRRLYDRGSAARLELVATDARAERYWQLLGIINGWPPFPAHVPAFEWMIEALRAHS